MAICEGLQRRRISTLTFNWRGVGASSGRASGELDDACEDYRGALAHLVEGLSDATEVVAAGYSFGAVAALAVALDDPHVSEVVVVAPPTGYLPAELATRSRLSTLHVIAAVDDDFCDLDELEQALAGIPGARITVIRGADHFFSRVGVDEIVAAVSTAP